jgi:hypothetical protein
MIGVLLALAIGGLAAFVPTRPEARGRHAPA